MVEAGVGPGVGAGVDEFESGWTGGGLVETELVWFAWLAANLIAPESGSCPAGQMSAAAMAAMRIDPPAYRSMRFIATPCCYLTA